MESITNNRIEEVNQKGLAGQTFSYLCDIAPANQIRERMKN